MKDIHGNELKEQPEVVTPKTMVGMLHSKRYAQLRKMGVKMEEIAAIALMAERGQFPGERLFTAKKKRELLTKEHKKVRNQTVREIQAKYQEMRRKMVRILKKSKKDLEKQGVDFDAEREKSKERIEESRKIVKEALKDGSK